MILYAFCANCERKVVDILPYYVKCPYYISDRYPTKSAERAAKAHPNEAQIMTCCECAKIVPPSRKSRAYLYEHFCVTDHWGECSLAQVMNYYYDENDADGKACEHT